MSCPLSFDLKFHASFVVIRFNIEYGHMQTILTFAMVAHTKLRVSIIAYAFDDLFLHVNNFSYYNYILCICFSI